MKVDVSTLSIINSGQIESGLVLEDAHTVLRKQVAHVISKQGVPFVVGGSNDQSYLNAAALLDVYPEAKVLVINIDAHLDVRPQKDGMEHSGSPFRRLLEDERFSSNGGKYIVFAAQGNQSSAAHVAYMKEHEAEILFLEEIRAMVGADNAALCFSEFLKAHVDTFDHVFVSFDIDSITGADCPGVSCPGITGLTALEACRIAFVAGACPKVTLFDMSEFNPAVEDYRTGKVVSNIFYHFLLGRACPPDMLTNI